MATPRNAIVLTLSLLLPAAGASAEQSKPGRLARLKEGLGQKVQLLKDTHAALSPLAKRGPGPSVEKMELYKKRKEAAKPGSIARALNHILQVRSGVSNGPPGDSTTESVQARAALFLHEAATHSQRRPVKALYEHAAKVAARQASNDPKLAAEIRVAMIEKWRDVRLLKNLFGRMGADFASIIGPKLEAARQAYRPYEQSFPDIARQLRQEYPPDSLR